NRGARGGDDLDDCAVELLERRRRGGGPGDGGTAALASADRGTGNGIGFAHVAAGNARHDRRRLAIAEMPLDRGAPTRRPLDETPDRPVGGPARALRLARRRAL